MTALGCVGPNAVTWLNSDLCLLSVGGIYFSRCLTYVPVGYIYCYMPDY
jgi:hypothetical protein